MSNNNMENQMSYISEMTEEEKIIFLRVLVALARSDNNFDDEEKAFIKDIAIIFGITKDKIDDILLPLTDDEVIKDASKIKKRQAALQLIKEACLLANSDGDLSDREIILIGKIGQAMGIELEKIEQGVVVVTVDNEIVWLEEGKLIFEQL